MYKEIIAMVALPKLAELNYGPLFESEEETASPKERWNKQTITWAMEPANKKQIYSLWRKQSKGRLGYTDYNNLFNELLLRLHTVEDWNFGISIERSKNGGSVPIAGYVLNHAKYVFLQEFSKEKRIQVRQVSSIHPFDSHQDEEVDIFSMVQDHSVDKQYDTVLYNINDILSLSEHYRYAYGRNIDLFEVIYLKLKVVSDDFLQRYFLIKGASIQDIKNIRQKNICVDGENLLTAIIKAISGLNDLEKSAAIVREYIYCADFVDNVINNAKKLA